MSRSKRGRPVSMLVIAVVAVIVPIGSLAAQVVGCSSADRESLLDDAFLAGAFWEAFEDTWKDAEPTVDAEGDTTWDGAKEQGGWIYRCWESDGTEFTKVLRWPEGDYWSIDQGPKLDAGNCALVGSFHTHTGSAIGHADNDGTPNETPSDSDDILAWEAELPSFVVHGHPNDPSSFGVTPYGPWTPGDACPPDQGDGQAESAGEPHLRTFDGHPYDFQAAGEFVLVRSIDDDLQVQARQEPTATRHVTMNTAIALVVDGSVVEVNDDAVIVDGTSTPRTAFERTTTPGGGVVEDDGGVIRVRWSDGSELAFVGRAVVMSLADARAGRVAGLLGDADGDPADDLVTGDGTPLLEDGRLTFDETYEQLAPAWRVTEETSLFTYAPGRGPADYVLDGVPAFPLTPGMLDADSRAEAEERCRQAGVTDGRRLDQCVFDVGVTGEESFAQEAAAVETELARRSAVGATPLVEAASLQQTDQVAALIAGGADPNGRDAEGRTPLLAAVPTGNEALVRTLLAAGADPNLADRDGSAPLHLAAFWGFEEIARDLMTAGADAHAEDDQGRTPADLATEQGHDDLAGELR